ncbi:MAG: amylo-alpha-1,6-glucosidase [Nitrospira sp.]|nr:amylo-alpha-1,6-glucosidase [Nitrospira sp.]
MKIQSVDCQDLDRALSLEWLETNGRGGFASGTVSGANTRRYHALLLVARNPLDERFVLVNHFDEWLDIDGRSIPLSTNLYPGTVHPAGYAFCTVFQSRPWPTWTFEYDSIVLQREILCVSGRDLVIVRWKLMSKDIPSATMRVRPMLSGRNYHRTHLENESLSPDAVIKEGHVTWQPYPEVPAVRALHPGTYKHAPNWYRNVQLPVEYRRGFESQEDWWSPGEIRFEIESGGEQTLALTSESVEISDRTDIIKLEEGRRASLEQKAPTSDFLAKALWLATDAYLSERDGGQTILAGYPWFSDWGRDICISLPGLCFVTGRHDRAWHIIDFLCRHLSNGLVPNCLSALPQDSAYNSIDASLWLIHAIERYLVYSHDETRVRDIAWPAIQSILAAYREGTRHNIHMDRDGLIAGGSPHVQLTWMNAKVGDWGVTPRQGKAVEIQALWLRALEVGERLAQQFGDPDYAVRCRRERALALRSFRTKFWNEEGDYLYDVIEGPQGVDASIRPNQLYALSLCVDALPDDQAKRMLMVVKRHLLTPVGLRTVSPTDRRYRPRYEGGVSERDSAYHQGTVWPYLLGAFVTAWLNVFGKNPTTQIEARTFLDGLEMHMREACMGQVSEIFDGDAPHAPRGCPAQAWSVAEPLRVLIEDLDIPCPSLDSR